MNLLGDNQMKVYYFHVHLNQGGYFHYASSSQGFERTVVVSKEPPWGSSKPFVEVHEIESILKIKLRCFPHFQPTSLTTVKFSICVLLQQSECRSDWKTSCLQLNYTFAKVQNIASPFTNIFHLVKYKFLQNYFY